MERSCHNKTNWLHPQYSDQTKNRFRACVNQYVIAALSSYERWQANQRNFDLAIVKKETKKGTIKDKICWWNKSNNGSNMDENVTKPEEVATSKESLFRKVQSKVSQWILFEWAKTEQKCEFEVKRRISRKIY